MDLQEQACWLTLVFKSGLPGRIIHEIIALWCLQQRRTLQEFFAADSSLWYDICQLDEKAQAKLQQARTCIAEQAIVAKELAIDSISMLTIADRSYPDLLRCMLPANQVPPMLFFLGDMQLLKRTTIAIIGSRHAQEESIVFAKSTAAYLATREVNIISGNARGIDRTAYDGAISAGGHTTVVLPHGIRKLSRVQFRTLQARAEAGNVLLLSQFHPDAPWVVSRAMERNKIVTGLAQIVIVAESDTKGGTWEGAKSALAQKRPLYVRQADATSLPGNEALLSLGGKRLVWSAEGNDDAFVSLLQESSMQRQRQDKLSELPEQVPLFIAAGE